MRRCEVCSARILFGPVRDGTRAYCSYECRDTGRFEATTAHVPDDAAASLAARINAGNCPRCGGPGPVDVQFAHTVWSMLVVTSWNSTPQVACVKCGRAAKARAALFSLLLGWWGFPMGLIMTPAQVFRNLFGMFGGPVCGRPSAELQAAAKLMMAEAAQRDVRAASNPGSRATGR